MPEAGASDLLGFLGVNVPDVPFRGNQEAAGSQVLRPKFRPAHFRDPPYALPSRVPAQNAPVIAGTAPPDPFSEEAHRYFGNRKKGKARAHYSTERKAPSLPPFVSGDGNQSPSPYDSPIYRFTKEAQVQKKLEARKRASTPPARRGGTGAGRRSASSGPVPSIAALESLRYCPDGDKNQGSRGRRRHATPRDNLFGSVPMRHPGAMHDHFVQASANHQGEVGGHSSILPHPEMSPMARGAPVHEGDFEPEPIPQSYAPQPGRQGGESEGWNPSQDFRQPKQGSQVLRPTGAPPAFHARIQTPERPAAESFQMPEIPDLRPSTPPKAPAAAPVAPAPAQEPRSGYADHMDTTPTAQEIYKELTSGRAGRSVPQKGQRGPNKEPRHNLTAGPPLWFGQGELLPSDSRHRPATPPPHSHLPKQPSPMVVHQRDLAKLMRDRILNGASAQPMWFADGDY